MVTIAVAQLRVHDGDLAVNANLCRRALEDAAAAGAELLVLPECALTGYLFADRAAAAAAAIDARDPELRKLHELATRAGTTVVVGFLERAGESLHNTAAVLGADGRMALTRKTHLPVLAADRFVTAGDRIGPVVDAPFGRVGVAICYDFRFPEVCRSLALGRRRGDRGARELVERGARARRALRARPRVENRVFVAVADRVGSAGDTSFPGASRVVGPDGVVLTGPLSADREYAVATAPVDLAEARAKATVYEPGVFEIDVFAHRRPDLYGSFHPDQEPHRDA